MACSNADKHFKKRQTAKMVSTIISLFYMLVPSQCLASCMINKKKERERETAHYCSLCIPKKSLEEIPKKVFNQNLFLHKSTQPWLL